VSLLTRRLPCPDGPPARARCQPIAMLFAAAAAALTAPDATAALSRWSASNNRIYVYGGGSMTLTDIRATTPSLPDEALQRVDAASEIWLLSANIVVEEDTTLSLKEDVTELRLKSNASADPATDVTSFVSITAGNFDAGSATAGAGTILVDGIKITSWDTTANAPDANTADGRAFMRARSAVLNAVPRISRMDILNSEIQYLGYEGSERYGLSWKANGDLALVDVLGDVKNSKIHHNHYGVYTFGLQGGQWLGNEVYENDGYGFDAHDHSDDLVIDGNNVHDNGKRDQKGRHGIILSESCLNARITNNTSSNNGGIDSTTGSPEGNGIMLHNFADDAIVQGNTTANNVDSGIAVFCSAGAQVSGNTVTGNGQYGIRLTVAARNNTIEGNTIAGSGEYGIFMQPATDSNNVCGDLTPRDNTFTGNTVGTSGIAGVKITDGTNNAFVGNTFSDQGLSIRNATGASEQTVTFSGNTFNPGVVVRLDGGAALPLRASFTDTPHVSLELDTGSTAGFSDDGGAIFDLTRDLLVAVTGSNSSIDLTADNAGNAFVVDTRALFVSTAGTTVHVAPTLWETGGDYRKTWIARADDGATPVQYQVGDLQPNVAYDVKRGDAPVGTFTADANGLIQFSDTPASTSTLTYAVTKSANQPPQSGGGGGGGDGEGGGGGGGSGDPAWLMGLLVALGRRRLSRSA
jgi:parallel beta-helix repeat protein